MRRRIRRRVVLRGGGHFHPKTLTRPSPEVDVFAAFAAKRARWVGGGVDAVAAALGAGDDSGFWRCHAIKLKRVLRKKSIAQSELEARVCGGGFQAAVGVLTHQAHHHHQAVAADFGDDAVGGVNAHSQQMRAAALRQALLKLTAVRDHVVRHAGVAQQSQQYVQRFGQRHQSGGPVHQIGAAFLGLELLPGVVGGQIKFTGASGNADAAADAHEPVVAGECLARFAGQVVQAVEGVVNFGDHAVECLLGHRGVAAVAIDDGFLALQIFQQIAFQVSARGHVHHFKHGDQGEVVVHGRIAAHELAQAVEQMLKPQHGADALVERIFVEDQGASFDFKDGGRGAAIATLVDIGRH